MSLDWPRDGRHLFAGGEWVELKGVEQIPSISPIDEQVVGNIAAARPEDIDRAVELITPALRGWAALSATDRVAYMKQFAQAIQTHSDELIELEILDGGLTRKSATSDLKTAIDSLDFFGSYAYTLTGETFPGSAQTMAYTVREPYGIVARIYPFNHPIQFAVQSAAPVLLAGNAVLLKAPEQTSLTTLALCEIARGVFPPGIFNAVTGYGHEAGAAVVAHPAIPRIGFTGSVPTGRRILEGAANHIKHVTLELGGKNPLIITKTADLDLAITAGVRGMNFNFAGQSCQSTSRVIVHSDLYDDVVSGMADAMSALVVGDPHDETNDTGPLAFKAHFDRVLKYIAIGQEQGAKMVVGGGRPAHLTAGYYVEPTLFSEVNEEMTIANDEIFGPVVVAMRCESNEEAIRIANNTELGLNSRVIAGTLDEAMSIGREIKAGTTHLNGAGTRIRGVPFGGYKTSGLGKQSCLEEVMSYTEEKSVIATL